MIQNMEQARKRAKDLLRAARAGDAHALDRLPRRHEPVCLADAQFAIARENFYDNWPELQRIVGGRQLRDTRLSNGREPRGDRDLASTAERLVDTFIDLHRSSSLEGPSYENWCELSAFVPVSRVIDELEGLLTDRDSEDLLSAKLRSAVVAFRAFHTPGAAESDEDGALYEAMDDAMFNVGMLFGRAHSR